MNSYFEGSGFYGGHHHQGAGSAAAAGHHHDQAAAAAYRFPLGLGMSPYASTQHHHHHSLHQARPPQDSPYDASVAACKLYPSDSTPQSVANYSTGGAGGGAGGAGASKPDCSKGPGGAPGTPGGPEQSPHQNGYAAVVAAAAAKDVWQTAAAGATAAAAGAAGGNALVGPVVRPAACTPDSRVAGYGSVGLVGGDPASSPGAGAGRTTASSLGSWNTCSLNSTATQPAVQHQPANHTFYPWMAIAALGVT